MTNETEAPDRLWANFYDDGVPRSGDCFDDPVTEGLKEYVSADLYNAQTARIAELEAERDATLRREKDANSKAFQHLRRAEKAEIASKNHAAFSHEWRTRAEAAEAKLAKAVALAPEILASLDATVCNVSLAADYRATLAELQKPIATRDDPA